MVPGQHLHAHDDLRDDLDYQRQGVDEDCDRRHEDVAEGVGDVGYRLQPRLDGLEEALARGDEVVPQRGHEHLASLRCEPAQKLAGPLERLAEHASEGRPEVGDGAGQI